MRPSEGSPSKGLRRGDLLLAFAVTALLLALWAAIVAFLGLERRQALRSAESHVRALSLAFEEQTFWLLASIEQLMTVLADDFQAQPDGFHLNHALERFSIPLGVKLQAAIISPDGQLLESDLGPVSDTIDLSDREHFRIHLQRPDAGIFLSKPVLGRRSGRWSIQITRRLNRPDDSFAGVLVISLDPLYFARFYQNASLGSNGAVELIGTDGVVRAFSDGLPAVGPSTELPVANPLIMEHWRRSPTGTLTTEGAVDGARRIYGYRQVRRYPLFVAVGLSETEVLGAWRDFATRVAIAGGGVSASILAMAAGLLAALRRRQGQDRTLADKQAELVRLNQDLAATQRIANLGSWEIAARDRRMEWSEETFRIMGRRREDGVPPFASYVAGVHPDDRHLLEASIEALFARAIPYEIELRHRLPSRGWNHVLTRAEPVVENGVVVRARGSMLDITGRKAQEAELRESRNLARQIADLSPNIIYILDLETRSYLYGNRDAWGFFGYTEHQVRVLGPAFLRSVVHPDDVAAAEARLVRFAAMGDDEVLEYEQRVRHASGEWRWLWYREKVFARDTAGRPVQVLGTGQDITERKRNEMKLDIARREAEDAARARELFLATVSHEIRTPMTGVLGLADLLMGTGLTPEQRRILDTLRGSASDLLTVLNDVLDFSKIQAGQLAIEEVDIDLHQVLRDIRAFYESQASRKGLTLELEIDGSTPRWIRLDPTRLRQVLSNLIGNAIKFTSQGGITIAVSGAVGADDHVLLDFGVADTGIGMTREQMGRLFQPFVQGDNSTTRRFGGTGLGLSISKSLVEAMGGSIGVTSRAGEGSTFRFSIRCRPGLPAIAGAPASETPAGVPAMRILLAEDNPVNRMLISAMLERAGHVVEAVEDGRKAVEAVAARPFDVVLLDQQMPILDGIEAAREIRRLPGPASRIPVIGLSADAMAETVRRAREAGFDDYVTKPVDWPKLHAAIDAAVAMGAGPQLQGGAEGETEAAPDARQAGIFLEHPVLVEGTVRELESFFGRDGSAAFYRSLIDRLAESLRRIRAAVAAQDVTALRGEFHSLRGAAGNMGAARLAAVLGEMDRRARDGTVDVDLVPVLEATVVLTQQAAEQHAAAALTPAG